MALLWLVLSALIQVRGQPLAGGSVSGSVVVPLERAEGGDTPVLTLASPAGRVRLLLDTGASSSMVTADLLSRLALTSESLSPQAFAFAGGGSDCEGLRPRRTRLPDLTLQAEGHAGRLLFRGIEALVMPAGALPSGVDGVLGAPTLRRQPFWIDPRGQRLAFGAAALREAASPALLSPLLKGSQARPSDGAAAGRSVLPLRWRQGVPLLQLRTPVGPVAALADTGAEGLFVSTALADRLSAKGPGRPLRLVGFCGEQRVEERPYSGLALGSAAATSPRVIPAVITANPIFASLGVEAIVGQELLRDRRQLWRLDRQPPSLELH